jgi:hypothetical protein
MIVTRFPEAAFSTRSFAVIFAGTGSAAGRDFEQWQSSAGHPQVGHIRPLPLE